MSKQAIIFFLSICFVAFLFFRHTWNAKPNQTPVAPNTHQTQEPILTESQTPDEISRKDCPSGFVKVPGNPLYKTSDFCVMKYEAKCVLSSDPSRGIQPTLTTQCNGEKSGHSFGTYKNSGSGCACTGDKQIASVPSGFPIAYIPEQNKTPDNAKNYCAHMGWHMVTNDEWMTIARNVEQVTANWCDKNGTNCGFAPGTPQKVLANGHYDSNNEASAAGGSVSNSALIASDDTKPCYGTTTDGSNICGGKNSQKRTLTLNNGELLWDLAGNVWEWVDGTVMRKNEPGSATAGTKDTGWLKSDFAPGSLKSVITDNGQGSSMGYDAFRPSNPTWNATNGVGRIYHYSSISADTNTTEYGFIRGGNWKHGDDDGAFTIHLSPPPDRTEINDVGFRCVAPVQ